MRFPRPLKMVRFHIVAGGFLAFSVGALLAIVAGGKFEVSRFLLGYLVVFLGDLSTHYSNDFFDLEVDKYVEQKKFFSGSNILVNNPDLRSLARSMAITLLVASSVLAIILVAFLHMPMEFLVVILGASLAGWFYSAPPVRLASRGLGELAVACVTGFAIPALGYLTLRGQFDPLFAYLAVPFIMYGMILSLSLEAPDVEIDRKGGKKNLAVRKGTSFVFLAAMTMALLATLIFCLYTWLLPLQIVDFQQIALFSLIPLVTTVAAFLGICQEKNANNLGTMNVISLFLFNVAIILYLVSILQ